MTKNGRIFKKVVSSTTCWVGLICGPSALAESDVHSEAISLNNTAVLKMNKNDYRGAVADFSKAVQIDPGYGLAYQNRALARQNIGDYKGVIDDCTVLIKLKPSYFAYFRRGLMKHELGDDIGAMADFKESKKLDYYSGTSYTYYAAEGFEKQQDGDAAGAVKDYELALSHSADEFSKKIIRREQALLKQKLKHAEK